LKKLIESITTSLIYAFGTLSTLIILFIIFFLFRESAGIFKKPAIEEGYYLVVHRYNPVDKISSEDVKKIWSSQYHNWTQLGGVHDSIRTFTIQDIEYTFTEEQLGADYSNLKQCISDYLNANTNIIAILPEAYIDASLTKITMDNITLKELLIGQDWYPNSTPSPSFGSLPILLGSFIVSLLAMFMALPLGLIVAVYLSEIASPAIKSICNTFIELLSGVPSVVYGFFGIVIVVPFVKDALGLNTGETAFTGSLILSLITLPAIVSISSDAISSVPREQKLASLALGANEWQTIWKVLIPAAKSGIASSFVLGMGRAFGETMAVLMVTGNSAIMPTNIFQPVRTITATIAAELGEAPSGGLHYESLFVLGVVLFVITFIFNLIAGLFTNK
jgi:phosphate transport system permease protein